MELIKALRGTRDILPDEIGYWQWVESIARDVLFKANYQEIRTPIFEQTALFERGIGEATDVVGKEMYTFVDRGERSVTLRPEGTAGVVRSLIENKLHATSGAQRLWYTGRCFVMKDPKPDANDSFIKLGLRC